jgi:hypothetical protein
MAVWLITCRVGNTEELYDDVDEATLDDMLQKRPKMVFTSHRDTGGVLPKDI